MTASGGEENLSLTKSPVEGLPDGVFFATVAECITDILFVKDAEFRYVFLSRRATDFFGEPIAAVLGRDDSFWLTPERFNELRAVDRRIIEGRETIHYKEYLPIKGRLRHFETVKSPLVAPSGQVVGLVGIVRDITEATLAEEALEAIQSQTTLAMEAAGVGWWIYDSAAEAASFSSEAVHILGEENAIQGFSHQDWLARIHEDDRERFAQTFDQALAGSGRFELRYRIHHAQKGQRWMRSVGRADTASDTTHIWRGIVMDETERLGLEAAVAAAKAEAERAMSSKGRLLAMASHDLRQPVQSMLMFAAMLRPVADTDPDSREALDNLERSMTFMKAILDDLLDISRLSSGTMAPKIAIIELKPILADLRSVYTARAIDKGLSLVIPTCSALVMADPTMVGRILGNLVDNAIAYTPSGQITVACATLGDQVRISVSDTGLGIDPGDLDLIWEEFYRVDGIAGSQVGRGLGLAIVRGLAATMGCKVVVESTLGQGSTFTVELARAPLRPSETPERSGADERRLQAMVVEDDNLVRESLRIYLTHFGYDVLTAASQEEALAQLPTSCDLDVVLADYRLNPFHAEDNTGIQVVHRLRAASRRDLPAVILTAEVSDDAQEEARAAGFQFIRKPISPEELLLALRRASQPLG